MFLNKTYFEWIDGHILKFPNITLLNEFDICIFYCLLISSFQIIFAKATQWLSYGKNYLTKGMRWGLRQSQSQLVAKSDTGEISKNRQLDYDQCWIIKYDRKS